MFANFENRLFFCSAVYKISLVKISKEHRGPQPEFGYNPLGTLRRSFWELFAVLWNALNENLENLVFDDRTTLFSSL